jgi:hypothetical protein
VVVVAVVAVEPGDSAGVDWVSRALLASAGFACPGAAPYVGCCCWHCFPECCCPDGCSGCSSCSPSKKCLEIPQLYAVIFIYLYLGDEVVVKVPKQSHDSHQALTSMKQNIKHNVTNDPRHDLGGF